MDKMKIELATIEDEAITVNKSNIELLGQENTNETDLNDLDKITLSSEAIKLAMEKDASLEQTLEDDKDIEISKTIDDLQMKEINNKFEREL